jgi:2-aminoethylphosphonate dioxygenase|tara:strand:- start:342 stop:1076 length:735 start_codon:yes stop_codon:yes gene_type:complete
MKEKENLYNLYKQKGYFKIKNFFPKNFINELNEEILNANNVKRYYDKNNKLRRIEKLYNKGEKLNSLNNKILKYIELLFKKNFVIFKDKFNAKPKGGDGFLPHYDGIFYFEKKDGSIHKGWHKYSNFFINVLVALDDCNEESGTLQVANADFFEFEKLLENTRKDGTPFLKHEYATKLKFKSINLKPGDLLFFSHLCPHKSDKNKSNNDRKILYYTYAESNNSDIYDEYYKDKDESITNKGGAL